MNVHGMIRKSWIVGQFESRCLFVFGVVFGVAMSAAGCGDSSGKSSPSGQPILILDNENSAITLLQATEAGHVGFGAVGEELILDSAEAGVTPYRSLVSANGGRDLLIGTEAFTVRFGDPDGDGSGQLQILDGDEAPIAVREEFVLEAQELSVGGSRDLRTIITALESTETDIRSGRWRDIVDGAQGLLASTESAPANLGAQLNAAIEAAEQSVVAIRDELLNAEESVNSSAGGDPDVFRVPETNSGFLTGFEAADLLVVEALDDLRVEFASIAEELRLLVADETFVPQFLPSMLLTLAGEELVVGSMEGPETDLKNARAVSIGFYHTCATDLDGALYCWGRSDLGELGYESTEPQTTPMLVEDGSFADISASFFHTCGIRATDGSPGTCWGYNASGQLSNESRAPAGSVNRVDVGLGELADIEAASQHSCAVKDDGTLWCWGDNQFGQLGFNSADGETSGVPPTQVGVDSDWASVSAYSQASCGLKSNGALFCWGDNQFGQLGIGDKQPTASPTRIGSALWQSLSVGGAHVCAVQVNGDLYCWGSNDGFELGLGDAPAEALVPTQVGTSAWKSVSSSDQFSCGIQTDDTLYCWGSGATLTAGPSPLASGTTPAQVSSGSWSAISVAVQSMCGIQSEDASLWCWGANDFGQLGTGDFENRLSPTRISR